MVDIHCHIIPGVDDGAKSVEDSLSMIEQARSVGVTEILTTPHIRSSEADYQLHTLHKERHQLLQDHLEENGSSFPVHLGCEVRMTAEARATTGNAWLTARQMGMYVLVELPHNDVPPFFLQVLFDYRLAGVTPIIAHPERNMALMRKPDLLIEAVKVGAHLQLTNGAISGEMGPTIKANSERIIRSGLASFTASDAHDTTNRPFTTWNGVMETLQAFEEEGNREGAGYLIGLSERIAVQNPGAVCRNEKVPAIPWDAEKENLAKRYLLSDNFTPKEKRKRFFFF